MNPNYRRNGGLGSGQGAWYGGRAGAEKDAPVIERIRADVDEPSHDTSAQQVADRDTAGLRVRLISRA